MKQVYIIHEHHPRLLLFFAGWGADETPFKEYRPADSDYMICYDYRDLSFSYEVLEEYESIVIVGWSMGVWAASQVMGSMKSSGEASATGRAFPVIREAIAINGTPFPIDEERGIPPAIYHGTLEGLTGASLHKFLRRMCANSAEFKQFLAVTPRRPLEELRQELISIEEMHTNLPASTFEWNTAIIGTEDRIIPSGNQKKAWMHDDDITTGAEKLIEIGTAHYDRELFKRYLEEEWTND